jgi:hypothetical protein
MRAPGGNVVDFKPYGDGAEPLLVIPAALLSRNPESFQGVLAPGFRRGDGA